MGGIHQGEFTMVTVRSESTCSNADLAKLFADMPASFWRTRIDHSISILDGEQTEPPRRIVVDLVSFAVDDQADKQKLPE